MVLSLLRKENANIGVDMGSSYLKMAQVKIDSRPILLASASEKVPDDIETGSAAWQRWAVEAIKKMVSDGKFKSKNVISSMPSNEIFIDHVKIGKNETDVNSAVFEMIKQRLDFDPANALVKCIYDQRENTRAKRDVVVMAADRVKVDRHIAIFEKAGLNLSSMSVWPLAIINVYTSFFARRAADKEVITMLLNIGANYSNIIIAKGGNLLFARVLSIGFNQLNSELAKENLLSELTACVRYFESMSNNGNITKLLFLSDREVDRSVCDGVAALAKQMHIPAQIGDALSAVEIKDPSRIFDSGNRLGWATAFGLSLTNLN